MRALAVIGAVALVAVLVGAVWAVFFFRGEGSEPPVVAPTTAPVTPSAAPEDPSASPPGDLAGEDAWLPEIDLASERLVTQGLDLRDVRVQATGARTTADGAMRFAHLEVDGVVTYASVEQQVGDGLRLSPAGDGLVRAAMQVSVLGRTMEVSGDAQVRGEGDRIVIDLARVTGAGALDGAIERLPPISRPVPGLPPGMTLTGVEVIDEGFRVRATGDDVTIRP